MVQRRQLLPLLALVLAASEPRPGYAEPSRSGGALTVEQSKGRSRSELAPLRIVSPTCAGEYADALGDLLPANAAYEKGPESNYSYCLRTVATYEHLYYGRGGKLKRTYLKAEAHGTGFAYRIKEGEYYLTTNQHVVEYPDVTDEEHAVEGVPAGSRKVREEVRIVSNESDDYEPGQIPLTKVVADPALDIAVLKTKHPLRIMPYRMGRSAGLRAGNVVLARGYPLGVFSASNTGKIINPYQEDSDGRWQHVDFVSDALLNSGNSGSPVFAVSCRTGELELVGVYHAHYTGGTGLGLVIGIDGIRDVLENLRLPKRDAVAAQTSLNDDRKKGLVALEGRAQPLFFPYADQVVRAEREGDGAVRFTLFRDFPLTENVHLAIVDRDGKLSLEMPSRISQPVAFGALDPQLRDPLERLHEALWHTLRVVLEFRGVENKSHTSDAAKQLGELKTRLSGRSSEQRELLSTVNYEAEDAAWPVVVDAARRIQDAAAPAETLAAGPATDGGAPAVPAHH